ncbi:hypothetical protein [Streptomyces candidus]|uniref:Uncharacterized protein n=1 Tax=Streptomyces candidus TaxID=67283 RepID=A0A7X0HJZ9_9ACTN|nr:hypothetical protein [Streptomyces candidus]MBB6438935.1 hypothetical protein [Streptomyces candidus]GHH44312.1 hypothetical protein GCM10018773_31720 [Streptomyces candidus]
MDEDEVRKRQPGEGRAGEIRPYEERPDDGHPHEAPRAENVHDRNARPEDIGREDTGPEDRRAEDRMREELQRAAASHRPDRARILARVERGMAQPSVRSRKGVRTPPSVRAAAGRDPRRAMSWPRVAGATAAVAAVLIAGGYGVAGALHEDTRVRTASTPDPTPTRTDDPAPTGLPALPDPVRTTPAKPSRTPERTPGRTSAADGTAPPAATRPPSTPAPPPAPPGGNRTRDGHLWGDGSVDPHSNDFWAQSNVTFKTGEPLTALVVELRIARTDGVTNTGAWISLPVDNFTVDVREDRGDPAFLVYRWTLKPGRAVPAGEHMAAGQYQHARGGRDAGGDRYSVTTTAQNGDKAAVRGDFYPTR